MSVCVEKYNDKAMNSTGSEWVQWFFSDPLYHCLFLLFAIFTAHFFSGEDLPALASEEHRS